MGDLDFYTYRERTVCEGEERLLIPMADPMVYEYPFNFQFTDPEACREYAEEFLDGPVPNEWVLIHYKGEIVT